MLASDQKAHQLQQQPQASGQFAAAAISVGDGGATEDNKVAQSVTTATSGPLDNETLPTERGLPRAGSLLLSLKFDEKLAAAADQQIRVNELRRGRRHSGEPQVAPSTSRLRKRRSASRRVNLVEAISDETTTIDNETHNNKRQPNEPKISNLSEQQHQIIDDHHLDKTNTTTTTTTTTTTNTRRPPLGEPRLQWPANEQRQLRTGITRGSASRVSADSNKASEEDRSRVGANRNQQQRQPWKHEQSSGNDTADQLAPLIHTDQLNTITKLLYIHPPKSFSQSQLLQQQQQHRQILSSRGGQPLMAPTTNHRKQKSQDLGQLTMAASEASFAPAQVAVLVASGSEPHQQQQQNQQQSMGSRQQRPTMMMLVPRFDVLDFEVTNSTATLTWSLSLFSVPYDGGGGGSNGNEDLGDANLQRQRTRLVGETAFQSDDRLDRLDAPIEIDDTASTDLRRLRRRRRRRDTDSVRATLNRRDDRRQPPVPPPLPPDDGLRELAELLEPEDIAGNREMTRHQSPATETRAKEKEDTRTIEPRPRPRELAEMSGFVRHGASDILRTNSTQIDDSVVTTNKTTTNTTTTNALATTSRGTPNPIRPLPVSSLGPTKRPPNRANRQQTTRSVDGPSTTSTTTITPTTAATKSAPTLVGRATSSGLNATTPTVNTATTSTKAPATSTNGTSANRFHQHQQQRLPSIPTNPPTRAATSNDEQEASVRTVSAVPMNRVSPLTGLIGRVTGAKLQMATMQARLASSSTTTTSTTSTTQKPIIASDHQMPAANLSTAGTERPHHRPLARQTTRTSKSVKLNSVAMDSPEANTTLPITLIPELGDRNRSLATEPTFASNKTATLSSTSTIPPIDTSALTARVTSKITSANSDSPLSSSSSSSRGADERDEAPSSKSVQFSEPEQKSTQATATTTSTSSTTVAPSSSSTTTTSTTSTTTTTTTTPPPPTPQSSPSTTVNNVVSVTKSQLVTSESLQRPSPNTRLTHTGSLASSSSQTQHRNKPQVPTVSKWMVRLRRFGSNEIDVVKVVVNELDQLLISKGDGVSSSSNGEGTPASEPIIRSITFKNLEPASGYEICVESASPNQLIGDKMNILNANHFLKCHDVSDVELNSNINNNNKSDARRNVTSSEDATLRRMDLMVDGNMRQAQPRLGELNHDELPLVNATSSSGAPLNKLKSLCREFFTTLNNNAAQAVPQAVLNLTTTGGAAAKQPARLSPNEPVALADSQSQDDSKTTATAATMNLTASSGQWPMIGGEHPRRPKSLLDQQQSEFGSGSSKQTTGQGNALKSHIELMEINLGNQGRPTETNGQKQQASSSIFEVVASSSNRQQLPQRVGVQEQDSMGPPTLLRAIQAQQPNSSTYPINSILTNYRFDAAGSMQPSHILPIVGCVFVLIFLATIANMLLNLVQCERSGRNPGGGGGGAGTAGSGGGSSAEEILASQAGGNRLVRHLNTAKRRRRRRQRLADALAAASAGSGGPRLGSPQSPTQMLAAGGAGLDSGSRSSPLLRAMGPGGRGFSSQSISGSYYSAGSEHSATSRSRMVIIGRNGEPFGSASGYFDVPPERRTEPAVDYGHISPGCLSVTSSSGHHPLLRSSREQQQAKGSNSSQVHRGRRHTGGGGGQTNETDLTSPHLATVNRSMHLLTSAARFPIGPSFAGDEKHNADMVGLARRNYDNFINNIYNADNLTSEVLANGQLHSGRQTIANNRHTTTTDDATVCSFHKQQELRNEGVTESVSSAASSAATVEAGAVKRAPGSRQRLRYDKVNPIYNMDNFSTETRSRDDRHTTLATFGGGRQQQAMQRRSAPDSAAAGGTITEDNQMADRDNLECSICNGSNGGANQIANSNQNQGPDNDGHSPEGDTSQSSPSGLDRQKQRFHAQQQQLERVMSKSGSLVPQPFINVNVGDSSADAGAYATFPEEEEGPNMGPAMAGDASTTKVDPSGGDSGLDQFVFGESLNEANQTHTGANHQVEHHHQDLEQQNQESQETTTVTVAVQQQLPPVPPPPPPLPALSPAPGSATNEGRSSQQASSKQSMGRISGGSKLPPTQSLADVQAMKGSTMMPNDEAIDKSDFRQRRNELAAKLHLAGMNKQQ